MKKVIYLASLLILASETQGMAVKVIPHIQEVQGKQGDIYIRPGHHTISREMDFPAGLHIFQGSYSDAINTSQFCELAYTFGEGQTYVLKLTPTTPNGAKCKLEVEVQHGGPAY